MSDVSERDSKVLWHPYTQHGLGPNFPEVVKGSGANLTLSTGQQILDAISSWWVNLHGHCHPKIVQAVQKQVEKLEHVIFAGFTHEPAVTLAEMLLNATKLRGAKLAKVFYSDNGSTSVETALKMAYQYQQNIGQSHRKNFLALKGSYHGDTLGAMAVSDPEGFHTKFKELLPLVDFVEADDLEGFKKQIELHGKDYCALIVEPLIQGASGMRIYSAKFLTEIVLLCKQNGVLVVFDEVFTGFYRTGVCFAFEHAKVFPDLLCLSKGLTGGFLPLAATLCTEDIYDSFVSENVKDAFLHGHSYTANPLSCAAAIVSWELLQKDECQERIKQICNLTRKNILNLSSHPKVSNARCLGTIGAIDFSSQGNYFSSLSAKVKGKALEKGVLLRPLGNVLYAVPPYCVIDQEVEWIYKVMSEILDEL